MSGLQWILVLFGWFSLAAFMAGNIYKAVKFASPPQTLRWEVYPIPHESPEKRKYGGSYMEEMDWTKKPLHKSLWGEIVGMFSEILFLERVKHFNNYGIWAFSMALHWGVYFLFGWLGLMAVESILKITVVSPITNIMGVTSFILGAFGCLALIIKRASNEDLNLITPPVLYFNLLFLLSIFATGLIAWRVDPSFNSARRFVEGTVFFNLSSVPAAVIINFLLIQLFLIYTPFSKFIHYLAKYFNFHKAFWDDAFKVKGSAIDQKNLEEVGYKFKWSGPHVDPNKTWLENALEIPGIKKGEKK